MPDTAVLRSNWRKVSSTDNLQAFTAASDAGPNLDPKYSTRLTGAGLLMLAAVLLCAELLVVLSKLVPSVDVATSLLTALQSDQFYIFAVPLTVPMLLVAVTLNWFSLKLFKHNS